MNATTMSKSRRKTHGVSWAIAATAILAPFAASADAASPRTKMASVIVQEKAGSGNGPEKAVVRLGGRVGKHIGVINGFTAQIPVRAVPTLRRVKGVTAVTPDTKIGRSTIDGWDNESDSGSTNRVVDQIGATAYWRRGFTGAGVDVAVIDSGVNPVVGLSGDGKVIQGPDLSFESQDDKTRYVDTFGHGTHMAGIIAGRDPGIKTLRTAKVPTSQFVGVAPDARIVALKLSDRKGAVDVSQVIAAIDWVVQHRNTDGLNIRVLNLSYGTDGTQDYRTDPLTTAVETAWHNGIAVVVSGGNSGYGSAKLNNPAYNPFVIAVGAADTKGSVGQGDDEVPSWSSAGDGTRNPDLVAPGKSIVSLRATGSQIDDDAPGGRVGDSRFFRGSGTSQAAAVVSGAAALVIQERPNITPDELKALLKKASFNLPKSERAEQGAGILDLRRAARTATPIGATQPWERANGLGSLDAARGSQRLAGSNGVPLNGEIDIFGDQWNPAAWSAASFAGRSWLGGNWNGRTWTGSGWSGSGWAGSGWSGRAWSGSGWSGSGWSGSGWSGSGWSGSGWRGSGWSGSGWQSVGWKKT